MTQDLTAHARELIEANLYVTLGTVGADGHPWTTPVYFAPLSDRELCWVSDTEALHSAHLAKNPQLSVVIFDSTVAPYHGRAVYGSGTARELTGDEVDAALERYPRPRADGATKPDKSDVTGDSPYRLYVAKLDEMWVLCPRGPRRPCVLHGLSKDHRARVFGG